MYALFKKEISNFLSSLIGIMVIVVFLLITGLFLWVFQSDFNVLNYGYANLDSLFILAPWVFLFLVPAVTMRSFAEENRTGTIEMLTTKPLSDRQIIWAKFLAGVALVLLALIPTFVYYYSVYQLGPLFGKVDLFIQQLGMNAHYSSLSRGVVDTRDVLYFLSVIALFLSATKLVLASRKW